MYRSQRARLRDYTTRSHERFMMLRSVGVCVCVCVAHAQALTGKREHGETEKKGKEVGDGGYRV